MDRLKLLIVDDQPSLQRLYEQELMKEGYEVLLAACGRDAVEMFRECHPALVVMDIQLPGMDGIEAMGRIHEEDQTVPIIIYSDYGAYQNNDLSWAAEVFLTKSSDLSPLKECIRSVIESRQLGCARASAEMPC